MRGLGRAVLVCALVCSGASSVRATLVNFDDLDELQGWGVNGPIPNEYAGLNWSLFHWYDGQWLGTVIGPNGFTNGVVSPTNVAYNIDAQYNPDVFSDDYFDFNGAYFTAYSNDNLNLDVVGYRDGSPVYSQTLTLSALAPTWLQADYLQIDKLHFIPYGGTTHPPGYETSNGIFAMDNFTYNESAPPVPEPTTFALFAVGMVAVVGMLGTRRRSK